MGHLAAEVIESVAEEKGVEPEDLDFVLSEYVDCDALNQFADSGESPWHVSFEIPEYRVTITDRGTIDVDARPSYRD
jgi:hypothetical protein